MASINVPITAFSGGEIGGEAQTRVDLQIYPTTAETMENVFPLMQGAMIKAPGTEYIGTISAAAAIVRPFIYNVDETRVLEISDGEMRFVDGNGYVAITGAAATIAAPVDNGSTGGSVITPGTGVNVSFACEAGGEARAYWEITGGVSDSPTTFRFTVSYRPVKVRIGTTTSADDILEEITFDPGQHIITFTPTASTYYFRARLIEEGAALLSALTRRPAGILTLPTPWLETELAGLRFEQSNDVMWIYHGNYQTRVLERRGDTSWSLRLYAPNDGPFEVPNQTDMTLQPNRITGSGTITASEDFFTPDHVNKIFEIEHKGQTSLLDASGVGQVSDPIRVTGVTEWVDNVRVTSRIFKVTVEGTFVGSVKLQRSAGNTIDWQDVATYSSATATQINDELPNQIIYYRFYCDTYTSGTIECRLFYAGGATTGRCRIKTYTSPTQCNMEVIDNFGAIRATTTWSEGSWGDDVGWPVAGQIDEGRHVLVREDRFFASVSDDYESHAIGVDSADAISRRIGTGDVNTARWIESAARGLVIGTSGAEIKISSSANEEAITPLNVKAKAIGDEGSSDAQAVKASGRIVYIDRTHTRLMQCYFNEDSFDLDNDDLTRLHKKIAGEITDGTDEGFVEVAYAKQPEPRLFVVRSDGQLAVMLYGPREGVYGWSRYVAASPDGTPAAFKSVCVVPGKPEDRVHVVVERTIDGDTVLYHERFALQNFPISVDANGNKIAPEAWRLQCALSSYDEAGGTVVTGLSHLTGQTVRVWGDGRDAGEYTVGASSITLNDSYQYVIVGLEYQGKWRSSKLAYGAQMGTALTMEKQVKRLGVIVHETPVGALKYGRSFEEATDQLSGEIIDGTLMDSAVTLWSNEENQPFEGETSLDSRVCLVMDGAAPVTVLCLVPSLELVEAG